MVISSVILKCICEWWGARAHDFSHRDDATRENAAPPRTARREKSAKRKFQPKWSELQMALHIGQRIRPIRSTSNIVKWKRERNGENMVNGLARPKRSCAGGGWGEETVDRQQLQFRFYRRGSFSTFRIISVPLNWNNVLALSSGSAMFDTKRRNEFNRTRASTK